MTGAANGAASRPFMDIVKIFRFDSAHSLREYEGKCRNVHGHTYTLEITVRGRPGDDGMVVDFHRLNDIINGEILEAVDHRYLNDIFDFNPTCENVAVWIWNKADNAFREESYRLERLTLRETPDAGVTLDRKDMSVE